LKPKILIVEDQFIEAKSLNLILTNAGYATCSIARSVKSALAIVEEEKPELVLVDIFLQGEGTGIDLGKILNERNIAFVYLSANSNRQILEEAKPTRPYGFMVKPFRSKDVLIMLDVALYLHRQRLAEKNNEVLKASAPVVLPPEFSHLVGKSRRFMDALERAKMVGTTDTSVLILGESGTGKELIAHSIHKFSSRKHRPFVVVNCGTLPANLVESDLFGHEKGSYTGAVTKREGKFELADGGTIFLDEIGELPLEMQVKFLRVLQEKEIEPIGGKPKTVNVRVLAATNKDLEEEVAAGRFRIDLYYRLNVFPLVMPPLRERKEDLPLLADYFLEKYSRQAGRAIPELSVQARTMLAQYDWPGNIRELENTIQRNIVLTEGNVIETIEMPHPKVTAGHSQEGNDRFKTMLENERDHILAVLENCNWKISGKGGAAEILDINVNTLNSRIKKLAIEKEISSRRKS
jgi:two-component system, NtrC family, response regulator HydG